MSKKFIFSVLAVAVFVAAVAYVYGGDRVPVGQPPLQRITVQNLSVIANDFNAAKNSTRLLLFFSPTCPVCLEGASATGRMLQKFSGEPVREFVVWEPVLWTDWSSPSTSALARIPNPRALQFWDKTRLLSRSMGEHNGRGIVWDYAAVYPAGTVWNHVAPPEPLYQGGPVIRVVDSAREAIQKALADSN